MDDVTDWRYDVVSDSSRDFELAFELVAPSGDIAGEVSCSREGCLVLRVFPTQVTLDIPVALLTTVFDEAKDTYKTAGIFAEATLGN